MKMHNVRGVLNFNNFHSPFLPHKRILICELFYDIKVGMLECQELYENAGSQVCLKKKWCVFGRLKTDLTVINSRMQYNFLYQIFYFLWKWNVYIKGI